MYNFRNENWNILNKKDRWNFYQGDSGHGTVNLTLENPNFKNIGFSYFLHIQNDFEEMIKSLYDKHYPKPNTFLEKVTHFFSFEPKIIQESLIKERIIQGFSSTTLSATIDSEGNAFFVPFIEEGLKEEIKSSKHGFLMANGYSKNLYKIFILNDKIKIQKYFSKP